MKKVFFKHADVWNELPDGTRVPIGRRSGVRVGHASYLDVNSEEYKALVTKFGEDAAAKMKKMGEDLSTELNAKYGAMLDGAIKKDEFEDFKKTGLEGINQKLAQMETDINAKLKAQGTEIGKLMGGDGERKKAITLKQYLETRIPDIKKLRKEGAGVIEISSEDLIKAGVISFSGTDRIGRKAASITSTLVGTVGGTDGSIVDQAVALGSPYLPGLGGSDLELFDIVRNPNFILNRVDVGTTNQSTLAWINEVEFVGTVDTNIAEGGTKPLIQHKFQVEFSKTKKAAAYMILTEEFEDDVPGLATAVRRMLQADVLRAFDDTIQANVIAVARPYEITGLNGLVPFATLFDACGALLAQIGFYNFVANTLALNPVTSWLMLMGKDQQGAYLIPSFMNRINALLVEANKVAVGYGLAGDLSQYKVDIYKSFTLRVGWINDLFIKNEFAILGEIRYHSYISDSRKKAIVYSQLSTVQSAITSGS